MPAEDYNPNSIDATLSKIIQRLDQQDTVLARIDMGVTKTNGRVTTLEQDKWYQRGFTAAIGATAAVAVEWVKSRAS